VARPRPSSRGRVAPRRGTPFPMRFLRDFLQKKERREGLHPVFAICLAALPAEASSAADAARFTVRREDRRNFSVPHFLTVNSFVQPRLRSRSPERNGGEAQWTDRKVLPFFPSSVKKSRRGFVGQPRAARAAQGDRAKPGGGRGRSTSTSTSLFLVSAAAYRRWGRRPAARAHAAGARAARATRGAADAACARAA
jgi:hypothetical protein